MAFGISRIIVLHLLISMTVVATAFMSKSLFSGLVRRARIPAVRGLATVARPVEAPKRSAFGRRRPGSEPVLQQAGFGKIPGRAAAKPVVEEEVEEGKPIDRPAFKRTEPREPEAVNRPYTLPPGQFRPKQSLGQNYLSDQNYVNKIVEAFGTERKAILGEEEAKNTENLIVEVGPGTGALSRTLFPLYPSMKAIEIDQRAVAFLGQKLPNLKVIYCDVLEFDWSKYAADNGGPISIVANLPYNIVSQVLFSLIDAPEAVKLAVVTMQLEVAERICARHRTKDYGIPSVIMQLYAAPRFLFKIPPKVFYPAPKVDSALISVDFTRPHPQLNSVYPDQLRKVVMTAFNHRRKMLRVSMKNFLEHEGLSLPDHWSEKRPEELTPEDFLTLTRALYKGRLPEDDPEGLLKKKDLPVKDLKYSDRDNTYRRNQKLGIWRGSLNHL